MKKVRCCYAPQVCHIVISMDALFLKLIYHILFVKLDLFIKMIKALSLQTHNNM